MEGSMSTFNRALFVINEVYADEYVKQHMSPLKVTQALADAGLLAPEPQIIRTRDELAALDPDTLVTDRIPAHDAWPGYQVFAFPAPAAHRLDLTWCGPMVVIATGDQVRAAQQALAEADREPETDDFHNSLGLWQPRPPATWKEA